MLKNFRGITLISLIVTIVVLLILAGVTIVTLTGDNGIITRAQEAKEKTEQARVDELRKLTQVEATTHLEEYEYEDENGEKITIPAQCAVSQLEGENTLKDGLVIIDVNGNEWVWIEVPKSIYEDTNYNSNGTRKPANSEDYNNIEYVMQQYVLTYRDNENKGTATGTDEWYEGCGLENSQYLQLKQRMLKSTYENEGFYIGRYEVGIKEENKVRNFGTDYNTVHPINETPVIQQNKILYNWVRISQAEELSERLAVGGKTSSLMFGIQWDLVMKYIESKREYTKDGTNTLIDQSLIKSDSTKWGNYGDAIFYITNTNTKYSEDLGINYLQVPLSGYKKTNLNILLTTGATERNSVLGIYDLAGNAYEWTLEKTTVDDIPCSIRGGSYRIGGFDNPASSRYYNRNNSSNEYVGFRSVLY